nr:3073_t:CDS:10 [Entrophospora candida]CAG8530555.1 15547_t:CDS:10 [Entrophospora candida]
MVRLAAYGGLSTLLFVTTIAISFLLRSNFYAACIYLSKSSACMMILMNMGFFLTIIFGKILQTIFFGRLRVVEIEHLYERAWYAVTETCLAMTIFRDEFDAKFVITFTSLLFLKIFHWLCQDRVEFMEQSPAVPISFHVRMVSLMETLCAVDALLVYHAVDLAMKNMRREEPWENKSIYVFYLELITDVYVTMRSFLQKCGDLIRYRRATRNMNERYPNATVEELERLSDKTCDVPKKLPCGHIFHFHCLRSWLERQQSCPTCRRPVLTEQQTAQQPQQAPLLAPAAAFNNAPLGFIANVIPGFPPIP